MTSLVITVLASNLMCQQSAPPQGGISAPEREALRHRERITSLRAVIDWEQEDVGSNEPVKRQGTIKVWLAANKLRADHLLKAGAPGQTLGHRSIECFGCEGDNYHLTYTEEPNVVVSLRRFEGKRPPPRSATHDPRLIGFVPRRIGSIATARIDSYVGRTDRTGTEQTKEAIAGVMCDKVTYRSPDGGSKTTLWLDPGRQSVPVKIEYVEGPEASPGYSTALEARIDAHNGVYFPSEVRFQETVGDKVTRRELWSLSEVAINQPIPAEAFTVAGLGLANDTYLDFNDRAPNAWVWKNGELTSYHEVVQQREADKAPRRESNLTAVTEPYGSRRLWLVAVAVGLLLAAGYFLYRATRGK